MVRRIEGTIDYEKRSEVLNDNHKILIYLDDITLTGELAVPCRWIDERSSGSGFRYRLSRWFVRAQVPHDLQVDLGEPDSNLSDHVQPRVRREGRGENVELLATRAHRRRREDALHHQLQRSRSDQRLR